MIGALRRCSTSLSRTAKLRLPSTTAAPSRSVITTLPNLPHRQYPHPNSVSVRLFHDGFQLKAAAAQAAYTSNNESYKDAPQTVTQFRDLAAHGLVSPVIVKTITEGMKFVTMTDVQSATLNEALRGSDMIAQAKTGTGKTLGFLLPVLQNVIKELPELETYQPRRRASPSDIRAIIISPTRELAEQIAAEAIKLTRNTGVVVQTAVGGSHKRSMLRKAQTEGCHILIGTPGRLNDVLSDEYSGIKAPNLNAIVLDEADRLLDAGFSIEIDAILKTLPDPKVKDRQTLMFSATVPRDVVQLVRRTLKPDFQFVKCVRDDEIPTHERVPQKMISVLSLENYFPSLLELLTRERDAAPDGTPFKVLVYFNTTAEVEYASSIFQELGTKSPIPNRYVDAIHGKLNQSQRTRATDNFRRAKKGLLLSSDVTARGMDFPDVTHVIQVGLPPNQEQYIHRIGRTGRAGKEGQGYIIVCDLEKSEARTRLRGLPVQQEKGLSTATLDMARPAQLSAGVVQILNDLSATMRLVPRELQVRVYLAQLGSFQWMPDKQSLIDTMNRLAKWGWGMDSPPSIPYLLAQKLRIERCQGVVLGDDKASRGRDMGRSSRDSFRDDFGSRDPFRDDFGGRGRGGFASRSRFPDESRGSGRGQGFERDAFGRGGVSHGRGFEDRRGFGRERNERQYNRFR